MRNRYVLLADLLACALAVCGAFALRFELNFALTRPEFTPYVIAAPLIKIVIFFFCGMYRRFWRYASVPDLLALCVATVVAQVAMSLFVAAAMYRDFIHEFSRSVLFLDWLLCLALTAAFRPVDSRRRGIAAGARSAAPAQSRC
jgi:FlaA1/EpsC-like NDP-sugar epimerase